MEQEAAAALHSLKCQYFQLVEPRLLAFPPAHILRKTNFQERLFSDVFAPDAVADSAYAPPPRYSARVLKEVVSLIEVGNIPKFIWCVIDYDSNIFKFSSELCGC